MKPRRRRILTVLGGLVTAGLVAWLAVRDTSPVGHFRSAGAKDRYDVAYEAAMAGLPAPDDVLDLRTSFGVVRAYGFHGTGPAADADPLVLLPGRQSASPVWAANLPSLRQVRSVWTLDLLGEPGRSIQDRPITSDEDQARWLAEALAGLPAERVQLLGLSIGGWTAANLVTRVPDRISGVTLVEPVMVFAGLAPEAVVRSVPASVPWLPKSWRDSFSSWTAGGAPVEDEPVADLIEAGMKSYALKLPAPTRIDATALRNSRVPLQVILAGRSGMHDAAGAARTARELRPDAVVKTYPEASHAINGEYPDELAADVAAFLAEGAATPAG